MSTFWKRDDAGRLSFPGGNGGYDVFVETGTNLGETLAEAAKVFGRCQSMEINAELCCRTMRLFTGMEDRVLLGYGDSGVCLGDILDQYLDQKTVFWLDAHATDGDSTGPQCPLLAELQAITAKDWKHTPLILIDDAPCFGAAEPMFRGHRPAEWPTIAQIGITIGDRLSLSVQGKVIVCRPR